MHIEIPAGVLETDEDPRDCAARELAEEVQLSAANLTLLSAVHTTPGFTDERIHIYLGTGLSVAEGEPDEDEFLQPVRIPLTEAISAIQRGEITDGKTICGLMLAYLESTARETDTSD